MNGLDNGDDNVLHPATKLRPGRPASCRGRRPPTDTDGDRALVGSSRVRATAPSSSACQAPSRDDVMSDAADGESVASPSIRAPPSRSRATAPTSSPGPTTEVEASGEARRRDAARGCARRTSTRTHVAADRDRGHHAGDDADHGHDTAQIIAGLNVFLESLKAAVNAFSTAVRSR